MPRIILENLVSRKLADGIDHSGVHEVDHTASPNEVHQGDDHEPNEEGTAADDEGILEANDVSKAEHGGAGIEFQDELGFVGDDLAPVHHSSRDGLAPRAERRYHEVIQTADDTADQQRLGALSTALTVDQHLGGSGRLRERILAVHLLHEILPERNEEKYAQHTSEQGGEHHLPEIDVQAEDVDGRQGENGAGDNRT